MSVELVRLMCPMGSGFEVGNEPDGEMAAAFAGPDDQLRHGCGLSLS